MSKVFRAGVLILGLGSLGLPRNAASQLCEADSDCVRECFVGRCAEDTCEFVPVDFSPCDDTDGNPCTAATCQGGLCRQEPPADPGTPCVAGNECLDDACDGSGNCGVPRVGDDCDDTDGNVCTRSLCDSTGICDQQATDRGSRPCDDTDGNVCTEARCDNFTCDQSAPADRDTPCSAGDECLDDACDGNGNCGVPRVGQECDDTDGNVCTRALCDSTGTCDQQATDRGARPCPDTDGDACTLARCRTFTCDQEADAADDGTPCDDGDACTVSDTCDLGECSAGPLLDCDDGDTCTLDRCEQGECACSVDPTCARQGCTPGYWKNNAGSKSANAWPAPYTPNMQLADAFDVPGCLGGPSGTLGTASLQKALGFTGNTSFTGSAKLLLRAAVAALLNSASACVQFPRCTNEVVDAVDEALASCDRRSVVELTNELAGLNALVCPLDQRSRCTNP